jgi:hypothetical protein
MYAEVDDSVSRGSRTFVGNEINDIYSLDNAHNREASLFVTRLE